MGNNINIWSNPRIPIPSSFRLFTFRREDLGDELGSNLINADLRFWR